MHASTVVIALFAASQALAAPTPAGSAHSNNARSLSAISNAIGDFAEDVLGPTTAKRDLDQRSLSAIENFFSNLKRDESLDARSLSAIENFFSNLKRGEDLDARSLSAIEGVVNDIFGKRSLSAIENFFSNLKRDEQLDARSLSAIENLFSNLKRGENVDARSLSAIEGVVNDIFGKRSLKAVGTAVAGGIASGVAGAVASDVLGRSEPSGVMVDTETGTLYMDVPDASGKRSLKAVGTAIAGGIASGVAGAVASDVLGRSEPSGLMVDTETGTLYMDIPDTNGARSLKAVGTAVAGGIASGVAGAVASDVLGRSEPSGLMVDTETGTIYMDVPDANEGRSLKAVGTAIAGGVASLAAGAATNAALGNNKRSDSGIMVDTDTGVIYMDVPDAPQSRSLKAVGTAVAGGIASGVAGAVAGDVLGNNKRAEPSGLMVDTDTGVLYMDVPDAQNARSLKAVGTAIAGGVASLAAGAATNAALGNNKRSESGLMVDTDTGVLYMDVSDANEGRSLKAVGTAVAGGIASGVAGAVASDVLGNNKRSLSAIENFFSNLKRDSSAQAINHQIKQVLQRSIDGSDIPTFPTLVPCKRSELEEMMAKRAIDDLE